MNNNQNEDKQLDMFTEESPKTDIAEEVVKEEDKVEMIRTERGEEFTKEEWESTVFDGGPTRQEVEEWKDKYGDIYFTPFEGDYYIWRTLSRPEYREVMANQDMSLMDREEYFTDKCVLFPRNYQTAKITKGRAGIPSILAEMIMEKSGFVAQTAPIKL